MLLPTSNTLNTAVILSIYCLFLGTISVFTGLSALEYPDLVIPGPQTGAPNFAYIQSDHFMRNNLLEYYQWYHELDLTDVINAMQAGNVTRAQDSLLIGFLLKSVFVLNYLETLVSRGLLIDDQTVPAVNLLLDVRHTIFDYFHRGADANPHFWSLNFITGRIEYRNLDELGVFLDRMQDALFSINLLIGNLPQVEVLQA